MNELTMFVASIFLDVRKRESELTKFVQVDRHPRLLVHHWRICIDCNRQSFAYFIRMTTAFGYYRANPSRSSCSMAPSPQLTRAHE